MRHLSPRGHLDGIVVNPFASSCLVDGTQVYSLVGFDPSTSFMFIAPCADPRIRFYGYIELKHVHVPRYMCTGTDQRLTSAGHQLTSAGQ